MPINLKTLEHFGHNIMLILLPTQEWTLEKYYS